MEENDNRKVLEKNKPAVNTYMKYSAMGIQMAVIIAVFSYLGVYLDSKFETSVLFTVIFALSGVFLSMYMFIVKIINDGNESKIDDQENIS